MFKELLDDETFYGKNYLDDKFPDTSYYLSFRNCTFTNIDFSNCDLEKIDLYHL